MVVVQSNEAIDRSQQQQMEQKSGVVSKFKGFFWGHQQLSSDASHNSESKSKSLDITALQEKRQ